MHSRRIGHKHKVGSDRTEMEQSTISHIAESDNIYTHDPRSTSRAKSFSHMTEEQLRDTQKMSLPDYNTLGFKDIIVSFEGSIVVVVINRAKK